MHVYSHTHSSTHTHTQHTGQMITQPPVSTTAALGTNATFSCRGIGRVLWLINGTQVKSASQPPVFAKAQIFVPQYQETISLS